MTTQTNLTHESHQSRHILLATLLLPLFLLAGCSEPFWQFPGGALSGKEQALQFAIIPAEGGVIQLETNPDDPYSVNLGCRVIDGAIYIDPAESRTWYQHIKNNPRVRIRFDGSELVHPALASAVSDPQVLSQFDADRIVLRLMPLP